MSGGRQWRSTADGPAGDAAGPGSVTRRRFLAAAGAAGLGLGSLGVLGSAGDDAPTPTGATAATVPGTVTADLASGGDRSESTDGTPILGANLNGRPHRIGDSLHLLDESDTTCLRAFLDVRDKLTSDVPPDRDPDVRALRRAAREWDCRLVVSLKWDFKANWGDKDPMRVPSAGSALERDLCRCATRYLSAIDAPVDVVVLGNEPMWETLPEDIEVADPPIVRFTRAVKDHLVAQGDPGDSTYLVGAFNRSHDDDTREERFLDFYREAFAMAREDEDVEGIDLHVHYGEFAEAEKTVAVARRAVPDGTITATEFSPIWRYDRHVHTPIGGSTAGTRFALDHGLPTELTAAEYFEHAKRNPRPPREIADFYDAMPWYNVNHLEDVYELLAAFDVSIGTFGFLQDVDMRNVDWTNDWLPFHINFLYQPALMRTESGIEDAAHPHYMEAYRDRTG